MTTGKNAEAAHFLPLILSCMALTASLSAFIFAFWAAESCDARGAVGVSEWGTRDGVACVCVGMGAAAHLVVAVVLLALGLLVDDVLLALVGAVARTLDRLREQEATE